MNNTDNKVVIVATKRTPIGQLQGCFAALSAPALASFAIKAMLNEIQFPPLEIDEVIMGCVLSAGIGQAPARQAAINADIPSSVGCTTVNKMCGSGMKAMMLGTDLILAGQQKIVLAGGMESMSQAPYLVTKGRGGYRLGHGTLYDHMFLDGLEDAYDKGKLMGVFAEDCASKYAFSRESQDSFAINSLKRAQNAIQQKWFYPEVSPILIQSKTQTITIIDDELPGKASLDKIPKLKPAFKENGTVTAANSSAISDGASVHLLMGANEAKQRNLKPLATILGYTTHAQAPSWFTTAPIFAIQKLLQQLNWKVQDVDLFEINEAFAVVSMAAMKELDIPHDKINVRGGACALGHPIGASGARIVTTLVYALLQSGLKRGIASLCIGGGEATAMAIEICGDTRASLNLGEAPNERIPRSVRFGT
ncbi:MAG: acetyl-CoA C-acyltransferase [Proteobacteria bacterium]|nr:acetyl-CoA C-acyltransferase [Pseudomonadota bacterium]